MNKPDINISEEINWLNNFQGYGNFWGGGGNGNIYAPISGGNGSAGGFFTAFYWMATQFWARYQRYMGRFLYLSNGYCTTAVNNLTILTLGSGFQFQTPNKSKQKKLDKWVKDTKFRCRDIEAFKRFLIDGEVFIRKFDDNKLRFIDPDYVYSSNSDKDQGLGIITSEDDYEDVEGYVIHNKPQEDGYEGENVSADEIQHRKNSHWGQRRGLSWILPVASDLFQADRLTNTLCKSADVIAKFAFFRKHESNQAGVQAFRDQIGTLPTNQYPLNQNGTPSVALPADSIENYADGSIVDLPTSVEIQQLEGLDGQGYMDVLDATLRKVASHFHLPGSVFGNLSEHSSYNSELVSNSYLVRAIEALQQTWIEYDIELLEMCGFDTSDITIVPPEVSVIEKDELIKETQFLLAQKLLSKQTASKSFGLVRDEQIDLIMKEASEPEELQPESMSDEENSGENKGKDNK